MLVTHEDGRFLTGVKILESGSLLWESRIWFGANAELATKKLSGYLVSGYGLNEFMRAYVCAGRALGAALICAREQSAVVRVCVFVLHLSESRAQTTCNALVWWRVAGGGRG